MPKRTTRKALDTRREAHRSSHLEALRGHVARTNNQNDVNFDGETYSCKHCAFNSRTKSKVLTHLKTHGITPYTGAKSEGQLNGYDT